MKSKNSDELIRRIDDLFKMHLSLRGVVQYVKKDYVGKDEISWGSSIPSGWFDINFKFSNKLTTESINELNRLSEYLNQNFIVRLHSLLEYEGIKNKKSNIDISLEGHEMIELLHYLRKEFAHKTGVFSASDKDSITLRARLLKTFNIDEKEVLPNQFPLDKNRVILPLVEGIKTYVKLYYNKINLKP